jgi:hypothetical protein
MGIRVLVSNRLLFLVFPIIVCCQGDQGEIGPTGFNSLFAIVTEPAGVNCPNGGIRISAGSDKNSNDTLDDSEITSTSFVCNGIDGLTTLTTVMTEPAGNNCSTGGVKINSGVDSNKNNLLDAPEIKSTTYSCNGEDGKTSLITILQEPIGMNCPNGGVKISSGVDGNANGTLDATEVSVERYICHGKDGSVDEQIRLGLLTAEFFGTSSSSYGLAGKGLIDFDIRFFPGVDSAVFASNLYCDSPSNTAFIELFNVTDNISIANSEVSTSQTFATRQYIRSTNIYSHLPEKKIEIGYRIRSGTAGSNISQGTPYLILYRAN